MQKNLKKLGILLLLIVVAIGSYFIAGTYARYTRKLTGSDTASVAKFSVSATGLNSEQTANINLFSTIKEEDTNSEEKNVANKKIAPGTGGKFTTTLTNDSEVDVKASITLEEVNNNNIPIEYSIDGVTWNNAESAKRDITLDHTEKTSGNTSEDVTIYWRWKFDSNDSVDTALGQSEVTPTVETKINVIFTQVD